jgi:hypothetical protein
MPCLPCKSPLTPLYQRGDRRKTMANKVPWFCTRHRLMAVEQRRRVPRGKGSPMGGLLAWLFCILLNNGIIAVKLYRLK